MSSVGVAQDVFRQRRLAVWKALNLRKLLAERCPLQTTRPYTAVQKVTTSNSIARRESQGVVCWPQAKSRMCFILGLEPRVTVPGCTNTPTRQMSARPLRDLAAERLQEARRRVCLSLRCLESSIRYQAEAKKRPTLALRDGWSLNKSPTVAVCRCIDASGKEATGRNTGHSLG